MSYIFNCKKGFGDKINYYLTDEERNFVKITEEEDSINTVYELIDNQYKQVDNNSLDSKKVYYKEEGTMAISCPACRGLGVVDLPTLPRSNEENAETYTCPRCNGMKTLARTTEGTAILEIIASATYNENADDLSSIQIIKYKTVKPGKTATSWINEKDIIIEEDPEAINN